MTQELLKSVESTIETLQASGRADASASISSLTLLARSIRRELYNEELDIEAGFGYTRTPRDPKATRWLCWWDNNWNAMVAQSPTGWFITFSLMEGFWRAMRQESETPGFLRTLESARTEASPEPRRLDDRAVREKMEEWEKQHGIRRYTTTGKPKINLGDLDL